MENISYKPLEQQQICEPRFAIGTRYKTRGKHPRECVVVDIYKTYNQLGVLVNVRYVSVHTLGEQEVVDYNVCDTTIAIGGGLE